MTSLPAAMPSGAPPEIAELVERLLVRSLGSRIPDFRHQGSRLAGDGGFAILIHEDFGPYTDRIGPRFSRVSGVTHGMHRRRKESDDNGNDANVRLHRICPPTNLLHTRRVLIQLNRGLQKIIGWDVPTERKFSVSEPNGQTQLFVLSPHKPLRDWTHHSVDFATQSIESLGIPSLLDARRHARCTVVVRRLLRRTYYVRCLAHRRLK